MKKLSIRKQNHPAPYRPEGKKKTAFCLYAAAVCVCCLPGAVFAAGEPLGAISNLSSFIFSLIRAIGLILLGFGIVQIGLALKGHDASQRAQGFMTFFGGVVIYFAKDILDMIL
mgnify:CR=1 FL=1